MICQILIITDLLKTVPMHLIKFKWTKSETLIMVQKQVNEN